MLSDKTADVSFIRYISQTFLKRSLIFTSVRIVTIVAFILITASIILPTPILAASEAAAGGGHAPAIALLFLAILLISGKIGGIVERFGQPAVLGEIAAGVVLSMFGYFGLHIIADIRESEIMSFFAELGAVILLFQIGLESNIQKMVKVGVNALFVALIGVIVPFITGAFVLGPLLFPDKEFISHLFLGAALVATSVGITAYVFQELKMLKTRACQTVLGAAVIDDVLGLLILAIVSALAAGGTLELNFLATLSLKAFGFLAAAVLLGNIFAKTLSTIFSKISTGTGMKLTLALTFAFTYAYVATLFGLAPIIGAFAAGLILDAVHFKNFDLPSIAIHLQKLRGFNKEEKEKINDLVEKETHTHIEDLISNISLLLVPIFFVYTGIQIDFASLLDPQLYFYAIAISIIAIIGKAIAGLAASGEFKEKLLVGVSMVPRGEVGLIFASVGRGLGVIDADLFSVIIMVVIITTFVSPPIIKMLIKKVDLQ